MFINQNSITHGVYYTLRYAIKSFLKMREISNNLHNMNSVDTKRVMLLLFYSLKQVFKEIAERMWKLLVE